MGDMISFVCSRHLPSRVILFLIFHFSLLFIGLRPVFSQSLTLVELNCENLFDCLDDTLKEDDEFLPDAPRHWTRSRYWRKLNNTGQELLSCSRRLPDLVAMVEVESDTVMRDLTRRSLLRNAGYRYLMTDSPDVRGLDVALMWLPSSFRPLCYDSYRLPPVKDMHPTRDILYVQGETVGGDTLHVFVVHAPSRYGGERESRPFRLQVAAVLAPVLDGLRGAKVIVAGDFNDYDDSPAMRRYAALGLTNVTARAEGSHGAKGTYRYEGVWHSLDHVLMSPQLGARVDTAYVNDAYFLLEEDPRHGGKRPKRTYQGFDYRPAFSDHLPLVVELRPAP